MICLNTIQLKKLVETLETAQTEGNSYVIFNPSPYDKVIAWKMGNSWEIPGLNLRLTVCRDNVKQKGCREYVIFSPDGAQYTTDNLAQFCRDHGLAYQSMYKTCTYQQKHYKKWQGYPVEDHETMEFRPRKVKKNVA